MGAPAKLDGLSQAEPEEVSALTGFDPSRIAVGEFVIVRAWRTVAVEQVAKVTPKQVKTKGLGYRFSTYTKSMILIAFSEKEPAERLAETINLAAKDRDRQVRDARAVFSTAEMVARAAYEAAEAKLIASAMSAFGQDAEERLEAKDDSAGPQDIAHD